MALRRRAPRRKVRRGRVSKKAKVQRSLSLNPQNQFATSMETVSFTTLTDNQLYQSSFNLGQFPRSSAIAACYKFCRPSEVIYEYTPLYNTFQEASSGGPATTVPLFYSYMNRTGDLASPLSTDNQLAWLLSTGARARVFNKKIVIKYKPNWLSSGVLTWVGNEAGAITNLQSMGAKAEYAWVPCPNAIPQAVTAAGEYATQPPAQFLLPDSVPDNLRDQTTAREISVSTNGVNYQGHVTYIKQTIAGTTAQVAELRITVKWEFKNPNPQFYLFEVRDPESLLKPVV